MLHRTNLMKYQHWEFHTRYVPTLTLFPLKGSVACVFTVSVTHPNKLRVLEASQAVWMHFLPYETFAKQLFFILKPALFTHLDQWNNHWKPLTGRCIMSLCTCMYVPLCVLKSKQNSQCTTPLATGYFMHIGIFEKTLCPYHYVVISECGHCLFSVTGLNNI